MGNRIDALKIIRENMTKAEGLCDNCIDNFKRLRKVDKVYKCPICGSTHIRTNNATQVEECPKKE